MIGNDLAKKLASNQELTAAETEILRLALNQFSMDSAKLSSIFDGSVLRANFAEMSGLLTPNAVLDMKSVEWHPGSAQAFTGGWQNITGASVTLTTRVKCTIRVEAHVTGYNSLNGSGRAFYYRASVGGVSDPGNLPYIGSMSPPTNDTLSYLYVYKGVAPGTIAVNLECQADSGTFEANYVTGGRMIATAYVE